MTSKWPLKTGPWRLADGYPESCGLKVFSTFSCGGGSTMGYKLAGYEVIGNCEIDIKMQKIYEKNHKPEYPFLMPIGEFNKALKSKKIPDDVIKLLKNIDVLDGSPPCSSFSMSGDREDKWGKKIKFREGQAEQVLDDLFFDFLDTTEILKPKVVVAENVKGMILSDAIGYVAMVMDRFKNLGYQAQLFLLNSSRMGVPQTRERVFFIARRNDFKKDNIKLEFNERPITVGEAIVGTTLEGSKKLSKALAPARKWCSAMREHRVEQWRIKKYGKLGYFNHVLVFPERPAATQTASIRHIHWAEDRRLSDSEVTRIQSFPDDFDFCGMDAGYVCGMSVPPFMMQRVADSIRKQWFNIKC